MATKRRAASDLDYHASSRKRTKKQHVDPISGQHYALSGPGREDQDEFDIEDCGDAMAYLNSVR